MEKIEVNVYRDGVIIFAGEVDVTKGDYLYLNVSADNNPNTVRLQATSPPIKQPPL